MVATTLTTHTSKPDTSVPPPIEIDAGDRFIREPETRDITGLSKSQRHNLMNQVNDEGKPRFPRKYSLGDRASAWLLSEVKTWMAERIAKSRDKNSEKA